MECLFPLIGRLRIIKEPMRMDFSCERLGSGDGGDGSPIQTGALPAVGWSVLLAFSFAGLDSGQPIGLRNEGWLSSVHP